MHFQWVNPLFPWLPKGILWDIIHGFFVGKLMDFGMGWWDDGMMMRYWVDVQKTSRVDLSIFLLGYTWIYYILTMIIYDLWWFFGILDRISSWDFEGLMEISEGFAGISMIPFMDGPAFGHEIHKWIYGYAYWDIYIYKYIYIQVDGFI